MYTGCFFGLGALFFEKVLTGENAEFLSCEREIISGETVFSPDGTSWIFTHLQFENMFEKKHGFRSTKTRFQISPISRLYMIMLLSSSYREENSSVSLEFCPSHAGFTTCSNQTRDYGRVASAHVRVCTHLCIHLNTGILAEKPYENQRNVLWLWVCVLCGVVWCCVVRKYKRWNTMGKLSKHGLRFWHDMVNHGHKIGPKTAIFADALFFYMFPTFCQRFPTRGPIPNAHKKALFHQRSYSKGPNHAMEQVLTNETPSFIYIYIYMWKNVWRLVHGLHL